MGEIVATEGALQTASRREVDLTALLVRHAAGDWGDMDAHDKAINDAALRDGNRLLSAYVVNGEKFYVVTEADRSVTTILLPDEY